MLHLDPDLSVFKYLWMCECKCKDREAKHETPQEHNILCIVALFQCATKVTSLRNGCFSFYSRTEGLGILGDNCQVLFPFEPKCSKIEYEQ